MLGALTDMFWLLSRVFIVVLTHLELPRITNFLFIHGDLCFKISFGWLHIYIL